MATKRKTTQALDAAPTAPAPANPMPGEVAPLTRTDFTMQFLSPLQMQPTDKILTLKLAGDYDKYTEILRDDQVASCFQQRRLALTCRELDVVPASEAAADVEAADFVREMLEGIAFDRITDKMLYGLFYGYSVGECMWEVRDGHVVLADVKVRQQKRFVFDVETRLRLKNGYADPILMPDRKFWIFRSGGDHDDDPYGRGLAHELYWPVFFKRNGLKFWLIYAEKFGQPTAVAKLPAGKAEDKVYTSKVLEVLRVMQTDSGVAIPADLDIQFLEAVRSSAGDYDKLYDRMDKAISKIILSQTMTTDDGSSRAQATVHEGVRDDVIEADVTMLYDSFNESIVRWLTEWNFPNAKPPVVSRRVDDEPDLLPLAQRDKLITEMGWDLDEQYITDTYGVEVTAKPPPKPLPALGPVLPGKPPASFSEPAAGRVANRIDQQQLLDVSMQMAAELQANIEAKVQSLVAMLEQTGDLATFRERLADVLSADPDPHVVEVLTRSGFTARLLGRLRAE